MSRLRIYSDTNSETPIQQSSDSQTIKQWLSEAGVRFEQWQQNSETTAIKPGTPADEIVALYRKDIDRLTRQEGYQSVDVISLDSTHPDKKTLREKFLDEHTHSEDEVRFFVAGEGLFSLHIGEKVYEVLCQQGDLVSVPANTPHWFDMGPNPAFIAIRFFNNPDGWIAHYTGSDIADGFSRLEN